MDHPFGGKDTSRTAYPSFSVTDDLDMLETAMEDADLANWYFLHLSDEDERLLEEIDGWFLSDSQSPSRQKRLKWL